MLLTLEDHRTTADRGSHCIADWNVEKIRAVGGDVVKLLAWSLPGSLDPVTAPGPRSGALLTSALDEARRLRDRGLGPDLRP